VLLRNFIMWFQQSHSVQTMVRQRQQLRGQSCAGRTHAIMPRNSLHPLGWCKGPTPTNKHPFEFILYSDVVISHLKISTRTVCNVSSCFQSYHFFLLTAAERNHPRRSTSFGALMAGVWFNLDESITKTRSWPLPTMTRMGTTMFP
jgi:hypothetical protein